MAVGLGNSWMDKFEERRREEDLVIEYGRKENTMVLGTEEIVLQSWKFKGKNISEYSLV